MQRHRISTNIGKDQVVKVELKQDFDLLEILSLKFTQKEVYTSLCADYGVVCGRISVNNGLGVPNARVSIFIPLSEEDEEDPVISALYPYKTISDKNENNYRYNLLPARKQHGGHEPTGTFPDQSDILTREEVLEVYEKYYKYTVKTNSSGDFMMWGVPLGQQIIHVDLDMSDVGSFSLRPYDYIRLGVGEDSFKNSYSFKSSNDIDSLPQIVTFDKTIEVFPFWGNEDLCEIGITRTDFDLSEKGIKIEPKAFLIGGTYTDVGKNSINKNCQPRRKMGRKCDLRTKSGTIEAIRFTQEKDSLGRPLLEFYDLNEDIPEDGSFVLPVPMNMEYLYTNEFGEFEITNDPNKGVPTAACYRFRFSLDDSGNERTRKTANYLVPNIREYVTNNIESNKSYAFSTNFDDYPLESLTSNPDKGIFYNENGKFYPRDYFFRMTYNKVYTVSSFHNISYKGVSFNNDRYVGLKELVPTEEEDCSSDVLTPPVNFGKKNFTFTLLIAEVLMFLEFLTTTVTLTFFNSVSRVIHSIGRSLNFWPLKPIARALRRLGYSFQEGSQRHLSLITYPECEECLSEELVGTKLPTSSEISEYCQVGSFDITGSTDETNRLLVATGFNFSYPLTGDCSTTAVSIPDMDYFIENQEKYGLSVITDPIPPDTTQSVRVVRFLENSFTSTPQYDPESGAITGYTITYNDISEVFLSSLSFPSVKIVYLENVESSSGLIEDGCSLYDTPYDESMVYQYYVDESGTIIKKPTLSPGDNVLGSILFNEDYQLVTTYDGATYNPYTESGRSEFSNGVFSVIPGSQSNSNLLKVIKEYYRRKKVAKLFCGGVVNFSFIENWLSGSLYFFQFKGRRGKFCGDVIRYNNNDNKYYYRSGLYTDEDTWGLNGGKINQSSKYIGRPTTIVDLGPRDEFIKEICIDPSLDPNCSVVRQIGSTSYQSFGEMLGLAINYRLDVNQGKYNVNDFFNNGGFTYTSKVLDGDLLQLISINNETGIEEFDLQNSKYVGYSYQFLDPELYSQVFKNGNSEWGPLPITLYLDLDGERVRSCINEPGRLTESSQKVPFFLWDKKGPGFGPYNANTHDNQSWDYSSVQVQPLQGMTYGYNLTGSTNDPSDKYLLLPMTYTFSGLTINTSTVFDNFDFDVMDATGNNHTVYDNEYPGFTYLYVTIGTETEPESGILYTRYGDSGTWDVRNWDVTNFNIRRTQDYYTGNKQILSTPFMFYFGLRPGNTGVDKFIRYFGDKGVFPSAE